MMGIKLQGNLCICGKVWFSPDIPENEPNRCPFCNRQIEWDDIVDESYISQQLEDYNIPDNIPDTILGNLDKAKGNEPLNLVTKICKFCTNELYFDRKDAKDAKYCPYCDDFLVDGSMLDNPVDQIGSDDSIIDMSLDVNINELIDTKVLIKFKSCNPFNKPVECVFLGVDYITSQIKFITGDAIVEWRPLDSVIYITTIKEK